MAKTAAMRSNQVPVEVRRARRASRSSGPGKATVAAAGGGRHGRRCDRLGRRLARGRLRSLGRRRSGGARGEVLGRGRHDPRPQPGRRLDDRHALGEDRQHPAELGDLLVGSAARREMRAHGGLLRGLEGTQHEGARQLEDLLVGQVAHGVGLAHAEPASRCRRIASRPRRIRLLTVPSGVAVRSAISCWVSPLK